MALLNTWASQQDPNSLSPLDRALNNYIQQGDAPLAYLMRGDAKGLLQDLNTPKPVNMTQDMTNAALNLNPIMGLIGATAYHGSPHIFDKFDISKVGTGEGAQAFGHGMYFAENPEIAKQYQKSLSQNALINKETGQTFSPYDLDSRVTIQSGLNQGLSNEEIAKKIESAANEYEKIGGIPKQVTAPKLRNEAEMVKRGIIGTTEGALYKVDIPDKDIPKMLNWDMPISKQSPEVLKALKIPTEQVQKYNQITDKLDKLQFTKGGLDSPEWNRLTEEANTIRSKYGLGRTGEELYTEVARLAYANKNSNPSKIAAESLLQQGITGIRYLDATSRGTGKGTSNFVVFDPKEVKILEKGLLGK